MILVEKSKICRQQPIVFVVGGHLHGIQPVAVRMDDGKRVLRDGMDEERRDVPLLERDKVRLT